MYTHWAQAMSPIPRRMLQDRANSWPDRGKARGGLIRLYNAVRTWDLVASFECETVSPVIRQESIEWSSMAAIAIIGRIDSA